MSLGTGAYKVSGVPAAMCMEKVSMATLAAETTPCEQLLTSTVTLKGFSGNHLPDCKKKSVMEQGGWGEEAGARIRKDSLEKL